MSEALCRDLDYIGLSQTQVDTRRKIGRYTNCVWKMYSEILIDGKCSFLAGSRAEGIGLTTLGSDTDIMLCYGTTRVIHRASDWELRPGIRTVLTDTSDVHPGYCRLQVMNSGEPTFRQDWTGNAPTTYNGIEVLGHYDETLHFARQQGPAYTWLLSVNATRNYESDFVMCFQMSWPPVAGEWIRRRRPKNFPPPEIVLSAETKDCHVVPTGHKTSFHCDREWRFSFALLEVEIVNMWPINTVRCYFLLKHFKNEIVKQLPQLSQKLSSYHMKTLMFWVVEETGLQYWDDHCLLECLKFCLIRLLHFVEQGCIPHYIIKENNLLNRPIEEDVRSRLIGILRGYIDNKSLFYQQTDVITMETKITPVDRWLDHTLPIAWMASVLDHITEDVCRKLFSRDMCTMCTELRGAIGTVVSSCANGDRDLSSMLIYVTDNMRGRCGTHMLSTFLKTKMSNYIPDFLSRMEGILGRSAHWRPVQLRMANLYIQTGCYRRATEILDTFPGVVRLPGQKLVNAILDKLHHNQDLAFLKEEIRAMPYALKFSVFRTTPVPRNPYESFLSQNANIARVDQDALVYYLQYLCYSQTGENKRAQYAFDGLKKASRCKTRVQEITLNLLGDCYLRRGDLRRAKNCFVQSLRVEPRYNSAHIHLAITIGKAMRRQTTSVDVQEKK